MNITKNEMLLLGSLHKERGERYEMSAANQSSIVKSINLKIELLNCRMMNGEQMVDGISIPKSIADLRATANTLSQTAERFWQKSRRKKICAARCFEKAKTISNGDCKVMPVGETDEYVINSREEYDAAIAKIKAHFDDEDRCGEYDVASSVEEEKQYHRASLAYIKYLEETLTNTQALVIAYSEKITEQKDSLLNMCARLGKMGQLAYHNIQAKMTEVFGDEEGAQRAAIKKEQWKGVERKCKETVERNNRPIELTVGDKHVSPKDLGWH